MIYLNFPNSPHVAPADIRQSEVVAAMVAKYPGFPGYVYINPDQTDGSDLGGNPGMSYPGDIYGPEWKRACEVAKSAGGVLIPRIGGCATHDLPRLPDGPINQGKINTLFARLRPSPVTIGDFASATESKPECVAYMTGAASTKSVFAAEANAKQPHIAPDGDTWVCAEYFLWDIPIDGVTSGWNSRRWGLREYLRANPLAKAIVEINSIERHGCGFPDGCPDWAQTRFDMALMFHSIDPKRVIVSVRPSEKWTPAQIKRLHEANQ